MTKRKVMKMGFVEAQWKPLLERFEGSRLRRGKALAKQGAVHDIAVQDKNVTAAVRISSMRAQSFSVRFPAIDWWHPYTDQVAAWLSRRPDWLAALFANEWDVDWLGFVDTTGLTLFPKADGIEQWVTEATCTCVDWEMPCQHIAAVVYAVISELQLKPVQAFYFVGISVEQLLQRVQAHSRALSESQWAAEAIDTQSEAFSQTLWPEERSTLYRTPSRDEETSGVKPRILPDIAQDKLRDWKVHYIAWK